MKSFWMAAIAVSIAAPALAQSGMDAAPMQTMLHAFYTNDKMDTMKSKEDMMKAWAAMSAADQKTMKDACSKNQSPRFVDLCGTIAGM